MVQIYTSVKVAMLGSTLNLKSLSTHTLQVKVKFNLKPAMKVKRGVKI
jgi:hypothetical protein